MRNEALLRQTHFLYASELPHNFLSDGKRINFLKKKGMCGYLHIMANYRTNGGKRNSRIH